MKKVTKKISALAVVLAIMAGVIGGTSAWFTAEDKVDVGTITTGSFDVYYDLEFDGNKAGNVAPGDELVSISHAIENAGSIPMVAQLAHNIVFEDESLDIPEDMITVSWDRKEDATFMKIGDFYYIKLDADETIKDLEEITIAFDGKLMGNEFISQEIIVTADALASQLRQDAAESTFGSADIAQKLADAGFFGEPVSRTPVVSIISAVSFGDAVFTFEDNAEWRAAITGIDVSTWNYYKEVFETKSVSLRSWVTIEAGKITIGNGYVKPKDMFFGEYSNTVTIHAAGYDDVVVDVMSITNP